jgi:hypothetical protein
MVFYESTVEIRVLEFEISNPQQKAPALLTRANHDSLAQARGTGALKSKLSWYHPRSGINDG